MKDNLHWRKDTMVKDKRYGDRNVRLMKKVIRKIANEKGFSKFQFYKIQNFEIWDKLVDLGYNKHISRSQLKRIRMKLPKGYYNKYF